MAVRPDCDNGGEGVDADVEVDSVEKTSDMSLKHKRRLRTPYGCLRELPSYEQQQHPPPGAGVGNASSGGTFFSVS